jgi:2-polyprenyl-6-hydroxyphenyl methylase/3-demethylubiquinone-9 3-methyltransferase
VDQNTWGTIDQAQIAHFDGDDGGRWGLDGPARWLHRYNAVRVPYIRDAACAAVERDPGASQPLKGLRILDIGCGAGILCEPLSRLGAAVVGVDLARHTIHAASARALEMGLPVEYRCEAAETLAEAGERFDVVVAMEVIEHVADYPLFLQTCATLAGPQGLVILSTINRTLKSWVQAIAIGEYVLGLLPRGAHEWKRFVSPGEIRAELARSGMTVTDVSGVTMNLRTQEMQLSRRTGVNYLLTARGPEVGLPAPAQRA